MKAADGSSLLLIQAQDNVAVTLRDVAAGERLTAGTAVVTTAQAVPRGHKIALQAMTPGQDVIKYGMPIGRTTAPVAPGEWVHTHNLATNLDGILAYEYRPEPPPNHIPLDPPVFQGYRRPDGRVGVRNEIWIIPTVGCVNRVAELIARQAGAAMALPANIDGVYAFAHPYGCSQLGEDHRDTQRILAGMIRHPNAGGVLVLGLGCENNHIAAMKSVLGSYDDKRVKFLAAQEEEDEVAAGVRLVRELAACAGRSRRSECPASDLAIGLKCGGSDAFSGLTANPLVGAFSDRLIACGGSTVLTEVPEMFGAETLLMRRAADEAVFRGIVKLINDYKEYYQSHQQPVYENPSPGNKQGGITTLEEKSLGCTQKGGGSPVVDVLAYGEAVRCSGLSLLSSPGNDIVAATALAAAGCQLVLFTTGRGTPLGTFVPTLKIASNSELYRRKGSWMDTDAGGLLDGQSMDAAVEALFAQVMAVASGQRVRAEEMGFREIAILKTGITL